MSADLAVFTIGVYTPSEYLSALGRSAVAALLYADSIDHYRANLASVLMEAAATSKISEFGLDDYARRVGVDVERLGTQIEEELAALREPTPLESSPIALDDNALAIAELAELGPTRTGIRDDSTPIEALQALFDLPALHDKTGVVPMLDRSVLTFIQWSEQHVYRTGASPLQDLGARLDLREGLLAQELLGALPAFPSAELDVVFDVRERLKGPRKRFRAAVHEAAHALEDVPIEQISGAVATVRRNTVEPAVEEIRESLEDLKVAPTLLRVASDRVTLASATASLAVVAGAAVGHVDLSAAAQTLAAVPALGGAAAREALARRETRRAAAGRPFYLLHELATKGRGRR